MTDKNYIKGIINKNEAVFRNFVNNYQNLVFSTCYSFLHNHIDAEDITQEVFIEVYKSIDNFRQDSSLSTWLYRIAVNKSLNCIRDNKKRKLRIIQSGFTNEPSVKMANKEDNSVQTYEDIDENNFINKIVFNAIDKLPENQKSAFLLNKYEDLSYKKIAEIMKLSHSAVESLIFRAKQNLQKELYHLKNKLKKPQ